MRHLIGIVMVIAFAGGWALVAQARTDKIDPEALEQIRASQEVTQQKLATAMNELQQIRQAFQESRGNIESSSHVAGSNAEQLNALEEEVRGLRDAVALLSTQVSDLLTGKTTPKLAQQQKAEMDAYFLGLDAYNAGRVDTARELLQGFVAKYPKSAWKPNVLYWIGETHFRVGHYEKAISAYQSVVQSYPQSPWVKRALFKQGVSFFQLKEYESSLAFFSKVAQAYPKSSEGFRALDYKQKAEGILNTEKAAKVLPH